MPLQATSGAASYDAFGGGVAAVPQYIEDVFSTWLIKPSADYTTYSINNGIDISTKGGMTWFKARDAAQNNLVYDTARGSSSGSPNALITNGTQAQQTAYFDYVTPNTNGFTVNYLSGGGQLTNSGINYASWTFRKQPKFFDVQTWTGTGSDPLTINHNLQSVPGCIIVKCTSAASNWRVHSTALDMTLTLNTTNAGFSPDGLIKNLTSTTFDVNNSADVNSSGETYVAYIFAHNAGGFGLTGTDNVISCGSYTGNGSATGPVVTLGYEPQWLMIKRATGTSNGNWVMLDVMRGFSTSTDNELYANLSIAEGSGLDLAEPQATGFQIKSGSSGVNASGSDYIYIAIRRGPMKVPTSGTSVYNADFYNGANSPPSWNSGFVTDMGIWKDRTGGASNAYDRLRGEKQLQMNSTGAESTDTTAKFDYMNGWGTASGAEDTTLISWNFRRAPSFMDVVCYTGTGSATTVTHNLGVVPELIITKCRGDAFGWAVYSSAVGNTAALFLETTAIPDTNSAYWNNTTPTSTVFSVGSANRTNRTSLGMVAYLFATCAGVSKVGSYTGNGTSQVINCGFTSGARFVLIKSTTEARSWCVFDTARGIASGNDPVLYLQATSAEVTSIDWLAPNSSGFEIVTSQGNINGSGQTYIFLAIA